MRFPWNKTADTPVFNGIPPHTAQLAKLESIERKVEQLEDKLIGRLDEMMTDRGFSSTQFKTQDIVDALMPEFTRINAEVARLEESIKSSCPTTDTGVVVDSADHYFFADGGVFDEDVECMGDDDDLVDDETQTAEKQSVVISAAQRKLQKRKQNMKSAECVKKRKYRVGMHQNRLNVLPQNFVFPKMTPRVMTENWLVGCVKSNIPPFATLNPKDVCHLPSGNKVRNKMKCVMGVIEKEARDKNVWMEKLADWNLERVTKMWGVVSPVIEAKYLKDVKRKTSGQEDVRCKGIRQQ